MLKPAGMPLNAFQIGSTSDDRPLIDAVNAAVSVHGDGVLPLLPLVRDEAMDREGAYLCDPKTGLPQRIAISRFAIYPEFSCLHEIGHFLDHQGLGGGGQFSSPSASALTEWRQAIRGSYSYRADRCQDANIRDQLEEIRSSGDAQIYPLYWKWDDFGAISKALDVLFLAKGWIE